MAFSDNFKTRRLTVSAMLLAVGVLLPQLFHLIGGSSVGKVFLPMHIPVLLCGLLCGPICGAAVGFICPPLSSMITGMPQMFPTGVSQIGELLCYGFVAGLVYRVAAGIKSNTVRVYVSLISAMIAGRIVSGVIKLIILSGGDSPLTWSAFISSALLVAWPGIVLQLVVIPVLVAVLKKTGVRI